MPSNVLLVLLGPWLSHHTLTTVLCTAFRQFALPSFKTKKNKWILLKHLWGKRPLPPRKGNSSDVCSGKLYCKMINLSVTVMTMKKSEFLGCLRGVHCPYWKSVIYNKPCWEGQLKGLWQNHSQFIQSFLSLGETLKKLWVGWLAMALLQWRAKTLLPSHQWTRHGVPGHISVLSIINKFCVYLANIS